MKKRVGILGGSFDPVHSGHVHIVSTFLDSGLLDEIMITLTPDPPHKKKTSQVPYHHRMEMLKLTFAEVPGVVISDVECSLPAPSYTLQTVKYVKQLHPENTYFLCMGGDSLMNFHSWYKFEELLEEVPILAARRPGNRFDNISRQILEKTIIVNNREIDVSSTGIRAGKTSDSDIPPQIAEYIKKHQLYND